MLLTNSCCFLPQCCFHNWLLQGRKHCFQLPEPAGWHSLKIYFLIFWTWLKSMNTEIARVKWESMKTAETRKLKFSNLTSQYFTSTQQTYTRIFNIQRLFRTISNIWKLQIAREQLTQTNIKLTGHGQPWYIWISEPGQPFRSQFVLYPLDIG